MWLAMLAQFAMSAAQNQSEAKITKAQSDANSIIDTANANAQNTVRAANNKLSAAKASLAGYLQSVNNSNTLEAAGKQTEAATQNYLHNLDQGVGSNFERLIQNSETMARVTAQQAGSSTLGATQDRIQTAIRLSQGRQQQSYDDASKTNAYNFGQQKAGIMGQAISNLDFNVPTATLDYSVNQAPINVNDYITNNTTMRALATTVSGNLNNIGQTVGDWYSNFKSTNSQSQATGDIWTMEDPTNTAYNNQSNSVMNDSQDWSTMFYNPSSSSGSSFYNVGTN